MPTLSSESNLPLPKGTSLYAFLSRQDEVKQSGLKHSQVATNRTNLLKSL